MSNKRKSLVRQLMAETGMTYQAALQELQRRADALRHLPPAEAEKVLDHALRSGGRR